MRNGILTLRIARQFPHCRVVGVDLLDEYLTLAKEVWEVGKLENVEFVLGRAEEVSLDEGFDCITSSYWPSMLNWEAWFKTCERCFEQGELW